MNLVSMLGFGLIIFLGVVFTAAYSSPKIRPQQRRLISGVGTLVVSGYFLVSSLTASWPLSTSQIVILVPPILGGLLLIAVACLPRVQGGVIEYLGWALGASFIVSVLFAGKSSQVQWIAVFVEIVIVFGFQYFNRKPGSRM